MGSPLYLGVHVSTAGGLPEAIRRAEELGCTALQLFTANARKWTLTPVDAETAAAFRAALGSSPVAVAISHAPYLLNLASLREELWRKSQAALEAECHRCRQLGIPLLVLHPGSAEDRREGIRRVGTALRMTAESLDSAVTLCIELTAGQGNTLGSSLEELAAIAEQSALSTGLGICIDTCHALAAGYRLDTDEGYASFWARFEELFGREQLRVLHLNDSAYPPGQRRDRHTHIGLGYCGPECFARLLRDPRWHGVPMILETPKGKDARADVINLSILRRLATGVITTVEEIRSLWRHGAV
jgi:deoxyribonuclease-4